MKKTIMTMMGCLGAVLALTSCGDDDNKSGNYTTLTYTNCFNYSQNRVTGEECLSDANVGYVIRFDFDEMKADVRIAGLQLNDDKDAMTVDLTGMPLRMSGGYYTVDVSNVVPVVNGATSAKYGISNFSLSFIQYMGRPGDSSVILQGQEWAINYTVTDGGTSYSVKAIPTSSLYYGETTVNSNLTPEPYVTSNPYYIIRFSLDKETKTVTPTVEMKAAKFAAAMPVSIDMVLKGATVDFSNVAGGYSLTAATMIPEVGNVPNNKYAISDFNARCVIARSADIKFTVDAMGTVVSKLRYASETAQSL
ncbi:MAG: hypothetical protein NC117_09440 [Pseudoflavonifractor sp.]|nr:hypothetical protein [Pseudoflavonifractor sp.]